MKIALVVHDLHQHGGESLYTKIMADALSESHNVTVFANRCEHNTDTPWDFRSVWAWRAKALSCIRTFPIGMLAHARTLEHFDIRHMQGYCGGDPNVVTAHRCMAAYIRALEDVSLKHRISHRVMLDAEARFYKSYRGTIIAVSHQIANELDEFYRVKAPMKVITHGVDTGRFNSANRKLYRSSVRSSLGIADDELVALYVGDLTKAHVHLKAFSKANPQVKLVIVSASRAYHWDTPNVLIKPRSLQIEKFYAAADVFVFPSANDPFGLVVLEAMASGLPVFCSDQAGASELITSGIDGFVIPLAQWVDATTDLLRRVPNLKNIGQSAEKTAAHHTWANVVRQVDQVYAGILK